MKDIEILTITADNTYIERRYYKRVIVSLNADIISSNKSYRGVIENVAEKGLFIRIPSTKSAIDFIPGTMIEVKFQLLTGDILTLYSEIRWLHTRIIYTNSQRTLTNSIGMEILAPPRQYKEFFNSLF